MSFYVSGNEIGFKDENSSLNYVFTKEDLLQAGIDPIKESMDEILKKLELSVKNLSAKIVTNADRIDTETLKIDTILTTVQKVLNIKHFEFLGTGAIGWIEIVATLGNSICDDLYVKEEPWYQAVISQSVSKVVSFCILGSYMTVLKVPGLLCAGDAVAYANKIGGQYDHFIDVVIDGNNEYPEERKELFNLIETIQAGEITGFTTEVDGKYLRVDLLGNQTKYSGDIEAISKIWNAGKGSNYIDSFDAAISTLSPNEKIIVRYINSNNKINVLLQGKILLLASIVEDIKKNFSELYASKEITMNFYSSIGAGIELPEKIYVVLKNDFNPELTRRGFSVKELIAANPDFNYRIANDGTFVVLVLKEEEKRPENIEDILFPLIGNNNKNIIYGTGEGDTLLGLGGDDYINGSGQQIKKYGEEDGGDIIDGGVGNDILVGGFGADTIKGGSDNDTLVGGTGTTGTTIADFEYNSSNDTDNSSDTLDGGTGDDKLIGGKGNDTLIGGDGYDTYVFVTGHGNDTIIDNDGNGKIKINNNVIGKGIEEIKQEEVVGGGAAIQAEYKSYKDEFNNLYAWFHTAKLLDIWYGNEDKITIKNFYNGDLGIKFIDPLDLDGDGLYNTEEGYNETTKTATYDYDGDGILNYLDDDDDNDNIRTIRENADPNGDHSPKDAKATDTKYKPDYLDGKENISGKGHIYTGAWADILTATGAAVLHGGSGNDIYNINTSETVYIDDTDGKGFITEISGTYEETKPHSGIYVKGAYTAYENGLIVGNGKKVKITNFNYKVGKVGVILTPNSPPNDPLMLDLNGDGIKTLSVQNGPYFDLDVNSYKEKVGWTSKEDGFLVMDRNNDNIINNGTELFGDRVLLKDGTTSTGGFQSLSELDENSDKIIDNKDEKYSQLKIWQDKNSDGRSNLDELKTLEELNITAISLSTKDTGVTDENGNTQVRASYYLKADGTRYEIGEYMLKRFETDIFKEDIILSKDIESLPEIQSIGEVYSLQQAMIRDSSLKDLVTEFINEKSKDNRGKLLNSIIYKWIGESDPGIILKKLYGASYINVNNLVLSSRFFDYKTSIYSDLMVQSHLKELFNSNIFEYKEEIKDWTYNLETTKTKLEELIKQDRNSGLEILSEYLNVMYFYDKDNKEFKELETYLAKKDNEIAEIVNKAGRNIIICNNTSDTIDGLFSDDYIVGNKGNDLLRGGWGNDIYIFKYGDGVDRIYDYDTVNRSVDKIIVDGSIDDYTFQQSGYDLIIKNRLSNDTITLMNQFLYQSTLYSTGYQFKIEKFEYQTESGSKIIDTSELLTLASNILTTDKIYGTSGYDIVYGTTGNDILLGGYGVDRLEGGVGNDTYIFNLGDGVDTIIDESGDTDTIKFRKDITAGMVTMKKSGNDVEIAIGSSGDKITVKDYYSSTGNNKIEKVTFTDGTVWSDLTSKIVVPKSYIKGFVYDGRSNSSLLSGTTLKVSVTNTATNATTEYSMSEISGKVWRLDQKLEGGNYTYKYMNGTTALTTAETMALTSDILLTDKIYGTSGADTLTGTSGIDKLFGGYGVDTLSGGAESDTYIFNLGDGVDTITDIGGTLDSIEFGKDITAGMVTMKKSGNDVEISIGTSGDKITVKDYYSTTGNNKIEKVTFTDGTVWSDLTSKIVVPKSYTKGFVYDGRSNSSLLSGTTLKVSVTNTATNATTEYSMSEISGKVWRLDQKLEGGNYTYKYMNGTTALTTAETMALTSDILITDKIYGTSGADALTGTIGIDKLFGGYGVDILSGGAESDTYIFNLGDGVDTITDIGGTLDSIEFGKDITAGMVTMKKSGNDVEISIGTSGDKITVKDYYSTTGNNKIEKVTFTDGTVWSDLTSKIVVPKSYTKGFVYDGSANSALSQGAVVSVTVTNTSTNASKTYTMTEISSKIWMLDQSMEEGNYTFKYSPLTTSETLSLTSNILTTDKIYGTSGADTVTGTTGNDTLLGGYGTDRLEGGAGDDTYIYKTGDGIDTISDLSGTDKLVFKDINESAATLSVVGNNLEIAVDGTNKVVVENYTTGNKIESVEFANGKVWNSSILDGNANVITGTVSGATLDGLNVKDIITGTSGNEIINGNGGDDTINGGAGDDTMYGGTGSDTYTFTEWSLNDVVSDVSGTNDLIDISKLTGTIEYQKSGTDLKIVETSGKGNITLKGYFDTATGIEGIKTSTETLKLSDIESKLVVTKPKQYFVFDARGNNAVNSSMTMELMGAFNATVAGCTSWSGGAAWKMDQVAEKVWVITTDLPKGTYEYKFRANSNWSTSWKADGSTSGNSSITITDPMPANSTIYGTSGADSSVLGTSGSEMILGGYGDDIINGKGGNDTYIYESKHGNDVIKGSSGTTDVLWFRAGITENDIALKKDNNNLIVTVKVIENSVVTGTNTITIEDYYLGNAIESFKFSSGKIWDKATIDSQVPVTSYTKGFVYDGRGNSSLLSGTLIKVSVTNTATNATTEYSMSEISGKVWRLDQKLEGGNYTYKYMNGTTALTTTETMSLTSDILLTDKIYGTSGADILTGTAGIDKLFGGYGVDTLSGGAESDTYIFNSGDGVDTITDIGGTTDTIEFGKDITAGMVTMKKSGNDVEIAIGSSGDKITVKDYYSSTGNNKIEKVTFADGTVWSDLTSKIVVPKEYTKRFVYDGSANSALSQGSTVSVTVTNTSTNASKTYTMTEISSKIWMLDQSMEEGNYTFKYSPLTTSETLSLTSNILTTDKIYGTSGADTVTGTTGNDTLLGGYGTDRLEGGAGDDTYIYKTGDGIDTISDLSGTDKLVFKDINESAATLSVVGNNLEISVDGTNKVVVENYATGNKIESVEFANGKVWNSSILDGNANVITGTVSGATLDGLNVKDIITGTSGNEIINGNGGDDTINGGAGDDTMYGGTGSDTYTFTEWSLNDVVSDVSGTNDLIDISKLTGTIEYQKSGTDLKIVETSGKGNITVKGYFDTATGIEGIKTSATETLKLSDIESKLVVTKPKQYFVFDARGNNAVNSSMTMELMGAFNATVAGCTSWSGGAAWKMDQVAEKVWVITTDLPKGTYEYKFRANSNWSTSWKADGSTSGNSSITITDPMPANSTIYGTSGADSSVLGTSGSEMILGGYGNDIINGKGGNDTYIYESKHGNDVIKGSSGTTDVLWFRAGITENDIALKKDNNNLIVTVKVIENSVVTGTNTITIEDYYLGNAIESFKFSSGKIWDKATIDSQVPVTSYTKQFVYDGRGNSSLLSGTLLKVSVTNTATNVTTEYSMSEISGKVWRLDQKLEGGNYTYKYMNGTTALTTPETMSLTSDILLTDKIYGTSGADILTGTTGMDKLFGGYGADTLSGGAESDTYIFNSGDGVDTLTDIGGTLDTIEFGKDITAGIVTMKKSGNDVDVIIGTSGDKITVKDYYSSTGNNKIEKVIFADGTVWSDLTSKIVVPKEYTKRFVYDGSANSALSQGAVVSVTVTNTSTNASKTYTMTEISSKIWMLDQSMEEGNYTFKYSPLTTSETLSLTSNILTTDKIYGTSGADTVTGTAGNDTLLGGYGTDRLEGGALDDTYIYKTGDGIDTISDVSGTDKLVFKDINESAATLSVVGNNLEISVGGTNKVIVENYATGNKIESVEFANGKVWNSSILDGNANVITGTVAGVTLDGLNVKDTITGTSGNEIINGNGGDDTINGGAGDDTMYGGTGSDTYTFTEWSLNDVVSDVSGTNDLIDISKLTGTIEYQKSGTDLKIVETSGKGNITLKGYFDTATGIEGIKTSATETLKLSDIESKLVVTKPKQYFVFDARGNNAVNSSMTMELIGTMNSWRALTTDKIYQMDQVADKIWVIATDLAAKSYEYKFRANNNWSTAWKADGGTSGNSSITITDPMPANSTIYGTSGADSSILGTSGSEMILGGYGNDIINGKGGNDTYIYESKHGNDVIKGSSGTTDVLWFRAGITENDIELKKDNNNLIVTVKVIENSVVTGTNTITIEDYYLGNAIESFKFGTTTTWNKATIDSQVPVTAYTKQFVYDGRTNTSLLTGTTLKVSVTNTATNATTEYSMSEISGKVWRLDQKLEGGNYTYKYMNGTTALTTPETMALTSDILLTDKIYGTSGADILTGTAGMDKLFGGYGVDTLSGGAESDTYIFNSGDGVDTITDIGGTLDTIEFGKDVTAGMVTMKKSGNDVEITVGISGDKITVKDYYSSTGNNKIEKVIFADGTVWSDLTSKIVVPKEYTKRFVYDGSANSALSQGAAVSVTVTNTSTNASKTYTMTEISSKIWMLDQSMEEGNYTFKYSPLTTSETLSLTSNILTTDKIYGTSGADTVTGTAGNDTLLGGYGTDRLEGGALDDTYIYKTGDGIDTISDVSGTDKLVFKDINESAATLSVVGNNLEISVGGTNKVIVENYATGNKIESVEFANGKVWNSSILDGNANVITGTVAGVTLDGLNVKDTITGTSGNEIINGNGGDDTINGGAGDDTMYGGTGSDTYTFTEWSLNDVVSDVSGTNDLIDISKLTGTIEYQKSGTDLKIVETSGKGNITLKGYFDTATGIEGIKTSATEILKLSDIESKLVVTKPKQYFVFDARGNNAVNSSMIMELMGAFNATVAGCTSWSGGVAWKMDQVAEKVWVIATDLPKGTYDYKFRANSSWSTAWKADGGTSGNSSITITDPMPANSTIYGTSGNDSLVLGTANSETLFTGYGNDTLNGGAGTDTLDGGVGDDTYIFKKGNGLDSIMDSAGTDLLSMDYNPLETILQQSGNDLILSNINNTTDKVTIKSWYSNTANQVEKITSSTGEVLLNSQVNQLVQAMATLSTSKGMAWSDLAQQKPDETKQILAQYWKTETK